MPTVSQVSGVLGEARAVLDDAAALLRAAAQARPRPRPSQCAAPPDPRRRTAAPVSPPHRRSCVAAAPPLLSPFQALPHRRCVAVGVPLGLRRSQRGRAGLSAVPGPVGGASAPHPPFLACHHKGHG